LAKSSIWSQATHTLELAKFLLDARGPDGFKGSGREYNQSHIRVVDQTEAVGHAGERPICTPAWPTSPHSPATRPTSTPSIKSGQRRQQEALHHWRHRFHSSGEAFGKNYDLPNMTGTTKPARPSANDSGTIAFSCLHADSNTSMWMERTLYNGLISGVSLDGKTFFYPNPWNSPDSTSAAPGSARLLPFEHHGASSRPCRGTSTRSAQ